MSGGGGSSLFQSNLPFTPGQSNFSFGGGGRALGSMFQQKDDDMKAKAPDKKEITVNDLYLLKQGLGLARDKVCKTQEEITEVRNRLMKEKASLGPMDNKKLLEPMDGYLDDPLDATTKAAPQREGGGLPPLIEGFRADKDAKVVSKEVYDYLKARHGVLKGAEGKEDSDQDVYRLKNKDCANWQTDV